jgi:hypothetical protein
MRRKISHLVREKNLVGGAFSQNYPMNPAPANPVRHIDPVYISFFWSGAEQRREVGQDEQDEQDG